MFSACLFLCFWSRIWILIFWKKIFWSCALRLQEIAQMFAASDILYHKPGKIGKKVLGRRSAPK
jgi:hypothetical protein